MKPRDRLHNIYRVWLRYVAIFRKAWFYGMVTTISEPLLILFAFGFGMGSMVDSISTGGYELTYRQFVFAGITGQAVLLQGYFEGSYGSFIRMYYQRVFQAIAVTPITLSEVLWAEIIWDSTRATISATVLLCIGALLGEFSLVGCLMAIPLITIGAVCFASMGIVCAALSPTIETLNYPQYLLAIPMFLFCGVFFPIENLPDWLEPVIHLLPLSGLVSAVRSVTLGLPFPVFGISVLLLWTIVLVPLARYTMTRRLVN